MEVVTSKIPQGTNSKCSLLTFTQFIRECRARRFGFVLYYWSWVEKDTIFYFMNIKANFNSVHGKDWVKKKGKGRAYLILNYGQHGNRISQLVRDQNFEIWDAILKLPGNIWSPKIFLASGHHFF